MFPPLSNVTQFVVFCSWHNTDLVDTLESIGDSKIANVQIGNQTVCLLGFGHGFQRTKERSPTEHVEIFSGEDGSSPEELVSDFVEYAINLREELTQKKMVILRPLYQYIEAAKTAMFDYFDSIGVIRENRNAAFSASPFGMFKSHLDRITNDMVVFAFRGESYDFPLLFKLLRRAVNEMTSSRLDIIKNGSKISRMVFRDVHSERITFTDTALLLSPGFSLAKFAEKCGIAEKKLVFPFGSWVDLDFLKLTEMPSDKKIWFDRLRQSAPEDSVIEKAVEEFKNSGASTVSDYLKQYLTLDVSLLGRATLIHMHQFYTDHNAHPLDTGRLTISSFSFDVAQKELFRNRRPAFYMANHPTLYSAARSSTIGGLSCVFRNAGGTDELIPDTWPKTNPKEPKTDTAGCLYLDFNGLYSSA